MAGDHPADCVIVADEPETRYARTPDGVHIAYQVVGDGPFDLVAVPGYVSHVEMAWDDPATANFLRGLSSFSRLILFDRRGLGLSDPIQGAPTLEDRMQDLVAVMDGAGSERAALFGLSEGGPMSMLFAATYPDRVLGTRALWDLRADDRDGGLSVGLSARGT